MIELPEAVNLAKQINETLSGKQIKSVVVEHTPHKLVWYYVDKAKYSELLVKKTIGEANAWGSMVEIKVDGANILLGEGGNIRFHRKNESHPAKHQLLIEFTDGSAMSVAVQMYGGMGAFPSGELDNKYYKAAKEKPSPLSTEFDKTYFDRMISDSELQKSSLKALLATEQRIPGLGNGVLQDILFNANMHPKKKVGSLNAADKTTLFDSLKATLIAMAGQRGRDTEQDLFGNAGGYRTILSKNSAGKHCPKCGTIIKKEAYLGGSIYYCEKCQIL